VVSVVVEAYPDFAGQIAIHHSSIDAHLESGLKKI
jgi:hypothetical protein